MSADDRDLTLLDEQAEAQVRRVWHEGRWFFSVIDVVGLLTDAATPRMYWADMKRNIHTEGFRAVVARTHAVKVPALNGKLHATDCADFATMMEVLAFLPAWGRSQGEYIDCEDDGPSGDSGIYAITNIVTQEQYIGSSSNLCNRFNQHRSLLQRGKHHATKLQEAWNRYGMANFQFEVLERLPNIRLLPTVEQQYLATRKPTYNGSEVAVNSSAAAPISADCLCTVIVELFESIEPEMQSPFLRTIKEAMMAGALRPGPNFHVLLEQEQASIMQSMRMESWP